MIYNEIVYRVQRSGLHPDDAREVIRIFKCMTQSRQQSILDAWPTISTQIIRNRDILEQERLVMIADPLDALIEGYEELIARANSYTTRFALETLQTNI